MPSPIPALTDGQLLARFARQQDEAAFAEVVARHAPMVLGVCRGILGSTADAEDAAQAVFLTLAQKASALTGLESAAGWLHRVAWYVAKRAAAAAAVRRRHEKEAAAMNGNMLAPGPEAWAQREALHEHLAALPDRYRLPLVLHHFEGRTQEEIAALLGLPAGTVSARLTRGRRLLKDRLARAGGMTGLAALAIVAVLDTPVGAAVPAGFTQATAHLAAMVVAGTAAAGGGTGAALALSQGALRMLWIAKLKTAALVAAVVIVAAGSVGGVMALAPSRGAGDVRPPVRASRPVAPQMPPLTTTAPSRATPWVEVGGRVLGPGDQPVADVALGVSFGAGGNYRQVTLRTDAAGRFAVSLHPAITPVYLAAVNAPPGLAVTSIEGAQGETWPGTRPMLRIPGVADQPVIIRLAPPRGRLGGTITGPDGQPVAGARVLVHRTAAPGVETDPQAIHAGLSDTAWSEPREGATNATGQYEIVLPPGVYEVRNVLGPAGSLLGSPSHWIASARARVSAEVPGEASIQLAPKAGLRVTVTGPDGKPVPGARMLVSTTDSGLSGEFPRVALLADRDGVVAVDGLPSGKASFTARGPDGSNLVLEEPFQAAFTQGKTVVGAVRLRRDPSGVVKVHATDPEGRPLAGLEAVAVSVDRDLPGAGGKIERRLVRHNASGATDAEGTLTLRDVPAGTVRFLPGDWRCPADPAIVVAAPKSWELFDGEEAAITLSTRRVPWRAQEGRVVDGAGRGVAGVAVVGTPELLASSPAVDVVAAVTDGDGRYRLERLPPGNLRVAVRVPPEKGLALPPWFPRTQGVAAVAGDDSSFNLLDSFVGTQPLNFTLEQGLAARLKITLPGAGDDTVTMVAVDRSIKWKGYSVSGSYPLWLRGKAAEITFLVPKFRESLDEPDAGLQRLEKFTAKLRPSPALSLRQPATGVSARLMEPAEINIDTTKGGEYQVRLVPSPAVTGAVVDDKGRPVANAVVTPWATTDGALHSFPQGNLAALTDVRGRFELPGLPAGQWALQALVDDQRDLCAADWPRVTVKPDEKPAALTLKLAAGGGVEGRVLDSRGRPVCGRVTVWPQLGGVHSQFADRVARQATEERPYRIVRLPPGKYTLRANQMDPNTGTVSAKESATAQVTIGPGGQTLTCDLHLQPEPSKLDD